MTQGPAGYNYRCSYICDDDINRLYTTVTGWLELGQKLCDIREWLNENIWERDLNNHPSYNYMWSQYYCEDYPEFVITINYGQYNTRVSRYIYFKYEEDLLAFELRFGKVYNIGISYHY